MALKQLVCLDDFEKEADRLLPRNARDYYRSGADRQVTLARTRAFLDSLIIRPRFLLRNVSNVDASVHINATGYTAPFPIGISPTASQCLAHPDGEVAMSRAASSFGAVHVCSTISTKSMEEIAAVATGGERWFQLYVCKDRELTLSFVRRAESAGFKALVVTVDTPFVGKRRADLRNGFSLPSHLKMANFTGHGDSDSQMKGSEGESGFHRFMKLLMDPDLTWDDIGWLQQNTTLPVIVKGVLTAEDAERAVQQKVAGIMVSNHGARQLDTCPSTIEALIEISAQVGDRVELFVDGGFRTGTDVLKALAFGAKIVFMGRPPVWGLAVGGEAGVRRVLEIAREELLNAMALSG